MTHNLTSSGLLSSILRVALTRHTIISRVQDAKSAASDGFRWLISKTVSALCALVGAALMLTSAFIILSEQMKAQAALAILATALWLMAGGVLLYSRRIKPTPMPIRNTDETLIEEIKKFSAIHPFVIVAAAFGVGLFLAQTEQNARPQPGIGP